jgi:hypothetical protein
MMAKVKVTFLDCDFDWRAYQYGGGPFETVLDTLCL